MLGYLGYVSSRAHWSKPNGGTSLGPSHFVNLQSQDIGNVSIYPFGVQSVSDNTTPAVMRVDVDVLSNTLAMTVAITEYDGSGTLLATLTAVGDTSSSFDGGASVSKFYQLPDSNQVASLNKYISYTITSGSQLNGSTSFWEALIKARVYAYPGWKNINLTGSSALTNVEPGIVNTPLGRQGVASNYQNEIDRAKGEIGRRLQADGYDLDMIPSDGVINLGSSANGYPQNIATHLVPELADAATYLTLGIIHERYATSLETWDAFKMAAHRENYEKAYSQALKFLPVNIRKDWMQDKTEYFKAAGARIAL